jgi:hypothetical protein
VAGEEPNGYYLRLRIAVALVITVVWACGYLLAVFDHNFQPPPEISGIMLICVTWLFGSEFRRRTR